MSDPLPRVTARLALRRLSVADLTDFQRYRHDEEVARYQGWSPKSDDEATAFLTAMSAVALFQPGHWFQVGIADRESDVLLGDIGVCVAPSEQQAEIGFSLCRQSQGQGLATEAVAEAFSFIFENSSCTQIDAIVDTRNNSAVRLLERLNMQRTQTVAAVFNGQPCEEHTYLLQK